jgi:hypothetical protein
MDNHSIKINDEEKAFFIKLALDLVDETIDSLKNNDIPLLTTYLDYLQQLCDYLAITFDAPNHIEINSEVFPFLRYLTRALTNDLQGQVITGGSNTAE